jgi:hypothetical protein
LSRLGASSLAHDTERLKTGASELFPENKCWARRVFRPTGTTLKKLPKQAIPCHNLRLVNEPAFDPSSQRVGEPSRWSRRDFVKLSFAASGAIIAASFVGSKPKSYRVAAVGADPYTGKVLDSIRQIQNVAIVSPSQNHTRPDLIVIGASDLSDTKLADLAANSASSVLIVCHVCQPIPSLAELAPARLRKGRFVHASGPRRLVPELISLSEMVQDRFCAANRLPISAQTEYARNQQRIFSGWALWIDPAA